MADSQAQMSARKGLVLDANILIRAVFGSRVRHLIEAYEDVADFCSPDVCFGDARAFIPDLSERRGVDSSLPLSILDQFAQVIVSVDTVLYESLEHQARERIQQRDARDWPVVAVALLLDLPVWTEDQDFFGCGLPTWTTDRVEIYLKSST